MKRITLAKVIDYPLIQNIRGGKDRWCSPLEEQLHKLFQAGEDYGSITSHVFVIIRDSLYD